MKTTEKLKAVRRRIDAIDEKLQHLISQRATLAQKIAKLKEECNHHYHQPEREAEILKKIEERNEGPLNNETLIDIFRKILKACLAIQKSPLCKGGNNRKSPLCKRGVRGDCKNDKH